MGGGMCLPHPPAISLILHPHPPPISHILHPSPTSSTHLPHPPPISHILHPSPSSPHSHIAELTSPYPTSPSAASLHPHSKGVCMIFHYYFLLPVLPLHRTLTVYPFLPPQSSFPYFPSSSCVPPSSLFFIPPFHPALTFLPPPTFISVLSIQL